MEAIGPLRAVGAVNASTGRQSVVLGAVMGALEFVLPLPMRNGTLTIVGAVGLALITTVGWRRALGSRQKTRPAVCQGSITRSSRSWHTWSSGRPGSSIGARGFLYRRRRTRQTVGQPVTAADWPGVRDQLLEGLGRAVGLPAQGRIDPPLEFPPIADYGIEDALIRRCADGLRG